MDWSSISNEFQSIRWVEAPVHLFRLVVAYLLALPTALDRERFDRSAGLRTFPLVAVGSCGYMLIGQQMMNTDEAHSRIIYGIITGIGFIGGGAILKSDGGVHGTATAASIWTMGAIGIAVAWQRYEIAFMLSAIGYITLRTAKPLKPYLRGRNTRTELESDSGDS